MEDERRSFIGAGEGASVYVGGLWAVHKLFGEDTNGAFSVVEHPVEPGVLAAPPHTHEREDEFSIVVEGEIGVWMDGEEFAAGPGDYVIKPCGAPHAFWNAGPGKARLIEIISPPGFEKYFDEMADLVYSTDGEPDFEEAVELGEKYGLTFHMEVVPELLERHGLTFE
ncbi:MAG: cupin domain-containing protein [Rubrobacter sp.]|nr:cupin domain-containing protein [Rubrobacter sp.]